MVCCRSCEYVPANTQVGWTKKSEEGVIKHTFTCAVDLCNSNSNINSVGELGPPGNNQPQLACNIFLLSIITGVTQMLLLV